MLGLMQGAPVTAHGEDGPVIERTCPNCRRYITVPDTVRMYNAGGPQILSKGQCSRCGPVPLTIIGWTSDYTEEPVCQS